METYTKKYSIGLLRIDTFISDNYNLPCLFEGYLNEKFLFSWDRVELSLDIVKDNAERLILELCVNTIRELKKGL